MNTGIGKQFALFAFAFVAGSVLIVQGMAQQEESKKKESDQKNSEEVKKHVDKLNSKRYLPMKHGLNDLTATVEMEMSGGKRMKQFKEMMKGISYTVYWKKPDRVKAEINGLDKKKGRQKQMAQQIARRQKQSFKGFFSNFIVPRQLKENQVDSVETDGENIKFIKSNKMRGEKLIRVLSKDYVPQKLISRAAKSGETKYEGNYKTIMVGEEYLIKELNGSGKTGQGGEHTQEFIVDYTDVSIGDSTVKVGSKFVSNITGPDSDISITYTLSGFKANQGLEDSIFGGKQKKEKAPPEQDKDSDKKKHGKKKEKKSGGKKKDD